MVNAKQEAITILNEALKELESQNGSVASGVQKLLRVARILNEEAIAVWCELHLGKEDYIESLKNHIEVLLDNQQKNKSKKVKEEIYKSQKSLEDVGVKIDLHFQLDDINMFLDNSGGGFENIAFIEEKYADLAKSKRGNDGIFFKSNLSKRIASVRRQAHEKAVHLFNKIAFTDAPKTTFDYLKEEVDDKLLDLNPELAEKLMIAFKSVSSDNPEEWSHALTSCRRLIEGLADELFPPIDNDINGRKLGQQQYINVRIQVGGIDKCDMGSRIYQLWKKTCPQN